MYLYLFESGVPYQSPLPPTEGDLQAVIDGELTILTFCPLTCQFYELDPYGYTYKTPLSPIKQDHHVPGEETHCIYSLPGKDWDGFQRELKETPDDSDN